MPDHDAPSTRTVDDSPTAAESAAGPDGLSLDARTARTPATDHPTLRPRTGSEVIGVSLRSLLDADEDATLRTVSDHDHYDSLRAMRRTDAFGRLRRYLGRRAQSVSLTCRSAAVVHGETASGDRVEVAVAAVDVRASPYDDGFALLARRVDDDELVAAGIEYVETERRSLPADGPATPPRRQTEVPVSVTAVDVLDSLEEERITLDAEGSAGQPAD